jgi:hypothetical protein
MKCPDCEKHKAAAKKWRRKHQELRDSIRAIARAEQECRVYELANPWERKRKVNGG